MLLSRRDLQLKRVSLVGELLGIGAEILFPPLFLAEWLFLRFRARRRKLGAPPKINQGFDFGICLLGFIINLVLVAIFGLGYITVGWISYDSLPVWWFFPPWLIWLVLDVWVISTLDSAISPRDPL